MILSLQALSFVIHGRSVLNAVNANFSDSAFTCLLGPNGAGKTTLLRILSGELKATSGKFLVGDTDACALSQREISGLVSIIPQGIQPPSHVTVFELVGLGRFQPKGALWWRLSDRDRGAVQECLARCQIDNLAERRLDELSGGEQQRAWLAFSLAQEKQFVLLDETLDGIDIFAKRAFFQLLKDVASENKGVILTTHDPGLTAEFADRVLVLNGGMVSYEGPPHAGLEDLLSPLSP